MSIPTWLYVSMIVILMILLMCIWWPKYDVCYVYVLLKWNAACAKVKYVVSCVSRLMSLISYMYECEYDISWHSMIKPYSIECIKYMRP